MSKTERGHTLLRCFRLTQSQPSPLPECRTFWNAEGFRELQLAALLSPKAGSNGSVISFHKESGTMKLTRLLTMAAILSLVFTW